MLTQKSIASASDFRCAKAHKIMASKLQKQKRGAGL